MSNRTLLMLADGMGIGYGGLKQMDPVGPQGAMIIDRGEYPEMLWL